MTPKAIKKALEMLPRGSEALDRAYEEAMERVENQKPGFRELAKQVLSWITCAKRPLTTTELQHALAVEMGESELDEDNLQETEGMVSACAGLVTVDKESHIIRLVHYTTQEYFERTQMTWFSNAQRDITMACVTYLSFHDFSAGFCWTDKEFGIRLLQNPLYDYAVQYWGHHARAASAEVEKLILGLLESEAKVSAAYRAMLASEMVYGYEVPTQTTGVHLAAYFGLSEVMIALLENRHDPDVMDTYGQMPLSWAIENGHEAAAKLLLEKGAMINYKYVPFVSGP
jgi:hypothetical protein